MHGGDAGLVPGNHHPTAGAWTGVVQGSITDPHVDWAYPLSRSSRLAGTPEKEPKPGWTLSLSPEGCPDVGDPLPSVYGERHDAEPNPSTVTGTFELAIAGGHAVPSTSHGRVLSKG